MNKDNILAISDDIRNQPYAIDRPAGLKYTMKKDLAKAIATERIHILISNALSEVKGGRDKIADHHAYLAKKIAMRLQLRMPYEIRQLYCKSCKRFMTPGKNARVRIGRSTIKSIRITCLNCGHTYHKVIEKQRK